MQTVKSRPMAWGEVDFRTWSKYVQETFYLVNQAWRLEHEDGTRGDAIVGLGPNGVNHVVFRLGVEVYELRDQSASLAAALAAYGFACEVDTSDLDLN